MKPENNQSNTSDPSEQGDLMQQMLTELPDEHLLRLQQYLSQEIQKRPNITTQMLEKAGVEYKPTPTSEEQVELAKAKTREDILEQVPVAYGEYQALGSMLWQPQDAKNRIRPQGEVAKALETWLTPELVAFIDAQPMPYHLVVKPNGYPQTLDHFLNILARLTHQRSVPPIVVEMCKNIPPTLLTGIKQANVLPYSFSLVPASATEAMQGTPAQQQKKMAELSQQNPGVPLKAPNVLDIAILYGRGVFMDNTTVQLYDVPARAFGFSGNVVPEVVAGPNIFRVDSVPEGRSGSTLMALGS